MVHFAIVGCGHIAKKHIEAIRNTPDAVCVAVCDTNPQRAHEFAQQNGVRGFLSLEEMLAAEPAIDVVNICTPSGLHAPLAVQAAAAKKHLIIEKPIALKLKDADAILAACEQQGVKLAVVHPNRFRPALMQLKTCMQDQLLGKLSHATTTLRWNRSQAYYDQASWRGTKELDGGVLMNQAIHNLDLLLWLVGPVAEVQAYTATRLRNIEAEDVALATVRFADGTLGLIEAAATIYPKNLEESIGIFGETGSVVIGGPTANWVKHWQVAAMTEETTEDLIQSLHADPHGRPGHEWIIDDMVEAIRSDRAPIVTGQDGRDALALVLAVYESAEQGRPVRL